MKRLFLIFLFFTTVVFSYSLDTLFKHFDRLYNIDYRIIKAIAKTESGFNPYAIGVFTSKTKAYDLAFILSARKTPFKTSFSSKDKTAISIYPRTLNEALKVINLLKELNVNNYDVGLMQINVKNVLSKAEERALFNVEYNLKKGVEILRKCFDLNSHNPLKAIECYNKGFEDKNYTYTYLRKFLKNYKEIR